VSLLFREQRYRTSTYSRSYLIRSTRTWNALPKGITQSHNKSSLATFKNILKEYYYSALSLTFDPDDPRTWKTTCVKCNCLRSLLVPPLVVFDPCATDYLYFGKTSAFPYQVIPDLGCGRASFRLFSNWIVCKFQSLCFLRFFHIRAITLYGKVFLLPMVKYIFISKCLIAWSLGWLIEHVNCTVR
jgi:hypothetical protein